jgi:hypothetical protein
MITAWSGARGVVCSEKVLTPSSFSISPERVYPFRFVIAAQPSHFTAGKV